MELRKEVVWKMEKQEKPLERKCLEVERKGAEKKNTNFIERVRKV